MRPSQPRNDHHCREKLAELHAQASAQVQALKRELAEDASASARRKQAAAERAAREREQRLAAALATMDKLQRKPPPEPRKPKPSKRRGRRDDDEPGTPAKAEPEPRVSTTDADARVMKMADGGFRPAFNAHPAVEGATRERVGARRQRVAGSDRAVPIT